VTSPANILLVDDEPRNLEVLEGVLQSPEHNLVRAAGAEQALLALLHQEFAVIVLDIQMPGTDGIELAHLIKQRERTRHVPIIFLTAFYKDEQRMLESYGVGAVDYLTKPANPQVLRSKVAVFVDLHRKTDALRQSNRALEQEIAQRHAAERALRETNEALEERVEARTAALREARDAAERSGRAKDDFIAALSHELRTPLNPVLLLASEAVNNPAFPAEARAQFLAIRKNVELEARLIDDLLDLTLITYGKMRLNLGTHDLQRIVDDAVETVRPEVEQKEIALRIERAPAPQLIAADEVRLQQVFWNLLKNAIKFTAEKGTITVATTAGLAAGTVAVAISDTGIGLSAAEMERIYDAFSQGDHATTSGPHRFGGLGLGLAISKRLVEQHRSRLFARSGGPRQGSTFIVELPLVAADGGAAGDGAAGEAARSSPGELAGLARAGRRVLLVEDHEPTRATLTVLLRQRGYDVTMAASLAEARGFAAEHEFDLLISDIGLPDGTGFELMRELRALREVRGIALTGYGTEEDISRSREAGFVVHLTKPVLIQDLDRALAELCR
jgi:signal transduction histidine kinase